MFVNYLLFEIGCLLVPNKLHDKNNENKSKNNKKYIKL